MNVVIPHATAGLGGSAHSLTHPVAFHTMGIRSLKEVEAMWRDREDLLEAFETAQIRERKADFLRNLAIFEGLFQEARTLGVFPPKDPLDGIEVDIRLASALNVPTTDSED